MFPGNSGGPIFYMPTVSVSGPVLSSAFLNNPRLIGVVSSYLPYVDVAISAQTKRPRITFEENSGLANAVAADEVINLLERKDVAEIDASLSAGRLETLSPAASPGP